MLEVSFFNLSLGYICASSHTITSLINPNCSVSYTLSTNIASYYCNNLTFINEEYRHKLLKDKANQENKHN